MQDQGQARDSAAGKSEDQPHESRPQRAGEAATTRFGMDEGDNTDTPATGQGLLEEDDEGGAG